MTFLKFSKGKDNTLLILIVFLFRNIKLNYISSNIKAMLKKVLFACLFSFGSFAYFAQNISGKVYSKNTLEPIEKAAITTNLNNGTATNVFGNFNLNLKNSTSVTFSCLGYETETLSISALKKINFTVYLTETIHQLAEIKLQIAKISLDTLLRKATKSMQENYISKAIQQDIYTIENQKIEFQQLELELKSSSIMSRKNRKLAQNELEKFSIQLLRQNPKFSKEFIGEISSRKLAKNKTGELKTMQNVNALFAYKRNTLNKDLSVNYIQENLQNIVLKHLRKDKTYKIKTGLFKIEDSLSFAKVIKMKDSIKKDNSYQEYEITASKRNIESNGLFIKQENEENFFNQKHYKHQLEKNEFLGTQKYYVISFNPRKSKAKFSGKVYINPSDFTFKKVIYSYADGKRGAHLNLKWALGVKYAENEKNCVLFYEKEKTGKVYTSYYKNSFKNYGYVNRSIKFIENSKEKEKVTFNIKAEVVVSENIETLLYNTKFVKKESIKNYQKEDIMRLKEYISKEEYELSYWKNRSLIKKYLKKYE
ncbi:MAG: hypothetical protein ACI9KF_001698 [Arenicella sp.]